MTDPFPEANGGTIRAMPGKDRQLTVLRWAAGALLIWLLLPWFSGQDDGEPLKASGWDTEPRFTLGMTAAGFALIALTGMSTVLKRVRWLALVIAFIIVGLTFWMLRRGDRYSTPQLFVGAYVTIAVEAVLVGVSTVIAAPRSRGGRWTRF